ncbi:hypothetical protein B0T10DRAFT_452909 [Thelonectria olida]|uniref:Deubiquitination-protection protein dph1 n=1 Tax=Thelonectria olida TaxID=1576542 RepID=A0A9P9AX35_9HYPO|nr:hypothetical protein B0T10DRAFT_452909 [Thelonectria olida]
MADNAESSGDAQVTFKVKTSSDSSHTITMSEAASVLDLKTKLAGEDFENIPVERQRLIYSGRVMKNDDDLATYKIKHNNTIHMVKSAASNQAQPASTNSASSARSTPSNVPNNMASGTANNPLAGLTGARYAGHQINLPGLDMFGPDGGMGPPMDEERLQRMMSDPNVQQSMNEALNNPDFVNMLIESNPMLRNMPNARQIISSPFMRQMMSDPQMMTQAMRMQRRMAGGEGFPAPGATDSTPEGAAAGDNSGTNTNNDSSNQNAFNPFMSPFMMPGAGAGAGNGQNGQNFMEAAMRQLQGMGISPYARNPAAQQGQTTSETGTTQTASGTTPTQSSESQGTNQSSGTTAGQQGTSNAPPANPFAALFGGAGAGAFGQNNTMGSGMNPELLQSMMEFMQSGGLPGMNTAAPADNRPPEERYAEQLRQLNDMGFYDFERNVAALRRSGGSVQGAIEHLLGGN